MLSCFFFKFHSYCLDVLIYFQHILRKSDDVVYQTTLQMMTYGTGSWYNPFKDKSGAYIFMPDGQAKVTY